MNKINNSAFWSSKTGEIILYFALIFFAAIIRLWNLDIRAMHYDEAIHAFFSWQLYKGAGYLHAPWTHGPLQFYGMALFYKLMGASEYSSRILPAVFGALLVGTPYFLRDHLGKIGGIFAALLLAISPSILYFSRFARDDIYVLVFDMLIVALFFRYLKEERNRYLYLTAAVLALFFSTMETSYFFLAVLAGFVLFLAIKQIIIEKNYRFESIVHSSQVYLKYFFFIVTLTLPLATPLLIIPFGWLRISFPEWTQATGMGEANRNWALACIFLTFLFTVVIGIYWKWRLWLKASLIFWGIYFLFFTSFFGHIKDGIASGIWGSIAYWLGVHKKNAIYEPGFYYLLLLVIYEFLPFILAVCATFYYSLKKDLFAKFLIYWMAVNLIIYGLAGEKPPWLVLHCVLPCILLASKFVGEIFVDFDLSRKFTPKIIFAAAITILVFFTGIVAFKASYRNLENPVEMLVYSQGSQDVKRIMKEIDKLAAQKGKDDFTITVDYSLGGSWLCGWYLRKYKIDWIVDIKKVESAPKGSVLILKDSNEEKIKQYLEKYEKQEKIHWIMWYPPFEAMSFPKIIRYLTQPETFKKGWRYFLFRQPWANYMFEDAKIFSVR